MIFKKISKIIALSLTTLVACSTLPTKAQEFTITIPDGAVAAAQLTGYTALALSPAGAGSAALYYLYQRAKDKFHYNYSFLTPIVAAADAAAGMALLPTAVGTYIGLAGMRDAGSKAFVMLTSKSK
jgi:ABC-type phosphate transport system substrate-binding protein